MTGPRAYVEANDRERKRMRALVEGLTEEDLRRDVNPYWTVAGVLGHIAFWDGRALVLGRKLERGEPFTPSDQEPEEADWINDASRPLIHAIDPGAAARLSLQVAEETDGLMAALPPDRLWPADPSSPINPSRADHRGEHLDDIEGALGS